MSRCKSRDLITGKKCGKRCKPFDEFDVRKIDEFGDAFDCDCGYSSETEAVNSMQRWLGDDGCVAVVCEHHTGESCNDHGIEDSEYTVVKTIGDIGALTNGGWIDAPVSAESDAARHTCDGCYQASCVCLPDDCNCDPE